MLINSFIMGLFTGLRDMVADTVSSAVVFIIYFRLGRWKQMKI